jgi:acyl-CoA synthetase (AMP-forming)/AMP-acid ligase II
LFHNASTAVESGEIGNLELSGPSLMLGYYLEPEVTARTIVDGWLATGDLGHVDAQGRVFLAGRSKDLIIRAGANVYPAEVEAVIAPSRSCYALRRRRNGSAVAIGASMTSVASTTA